MKIMKRSGIEADFDVTKISAAIKKANCEVAAVDQLSEEQIEEISTNVEKICSDIGRTLGVEEIQDLVEDQIMNKRAFVLARKYITYRYTRALIRKSNSSSILSRATSTDNYIFVVVCFLYLYSRYEFANNSVIIQYESRTEADQINFKQNPHQYPISSS